MPTTITSAGVTFNDATSLTSANGVPSALKLTTARTINGVSFDGTADITVPATGTSAAKAWVNFDGASAFYTTGNTVTYVANSPSAGQTTVTVDRTATWSPLPDVGDWVTVSGVTGATAVNGTFQITEVDNVAFNIKYIVPSVVTGTVGGTATVYIAAIRSSYNVSSVTKNSSGKYTVNFATALNDANYSTAVDSGGYGVQYQSGKIAADASGNPLLKTTSQCQIFSNSGNAVDSSYVSLIVFGN